MTISFDLSVPRATRTLSVRWLLKIRRPYCHENHTHVSGDTLFVSTPIFLETHFKDVRS
jgi:hypothetical protein